MTTLKYRPTHCPRIRELQLPRLTFFAGPCETRNVRGTLIALLKRSRAKLCFARQPIFYIFFIFFAIDARAIEFTYVFKRDEPPRPTIKQTFRHTIPSLGENFGVGDIEITPATTPQQLVNTIRDRLLDQNRGNYLEGTTASVGLTDKGFWFVTGSIPINNNLRPRDRSSFPSSQESGRMKLEEKKNTIIQNNDGAPNNDGAFLQYFFQSDDPTSALTEGELYSVTLTAGNDTYLSSLLASTGDTENDLFENIQSDFISQGASITCSSICISNTIYSSSVAWNFSGNSGSNLIYGAQVDVPGPLGIFGVLQFYSVSRSLRKKIKSNHLTIPDDTKVC